MNIQELIKEKQKLDAEIEALNDSLRPLQNKRWEIQLKIERLNFENSLPLTVETVAKIDMDQFERFPKEYSEFIRTFKYIDSSGFSSENLSISFQIRVDKKTPINELVNEANQFFPHIVPKKFEKITNGVFASKKEETTYPALRLFISSSLENGGYSYLCFESPEKVHIINRSYGGFSSILESFDSLEKAFICIQKKIKD